MREDFLATKCHCFSFVGLVSVTFYLVFLLSFILRIFIFVMVFSITLVASVSRIRCAMLCCSEEFEVDDNLKFCIRFRRGGTYVNHFFNLFVVQYRYA